LSGQPPRGGVGGELRELVGQIVQQLRKPLNKVRHIANERSGHAKGQDGEIAAWIDALLPEPPRVPGHPSEGAPASRDLADASSGSRPPWLYLLASERLRRDLVALGARCWRS
jgi:hypothetical protein